MGWLGKHDPPPKLCPWSGKKIPRDRHVHEQYDRKGGKFLPKGSNWKWSKK